VKHHLFGYYKPLNNPYVDRFIRNSHRTANITVVPIQRTAAAFEEAEGRVIAHMMVADQTPSNRKTAIWVWFMGRATACLPGPEKYARRYELPVVYLSLRRIRRGYYEAEFEVLEETPHLLPEGELTARYMQRLWRDIETHPTDWLWSHRRWKLEPEADTRVVSVG
jgi:KDO2-lipid IV(A) lauroyltransferase